MSRIFPFCRSFFIVFALFWVSGCALKEAQYKDAANAEASNSLTRIADSSFEAGNYGPALDLYLRAYKKKEDNATLEKIAVTYARMDNPIASYQAYALLHKKDPDNALYLKNLAQAAFYAEDFEASRAYYKKLLAMDQSDAARLGAGVVEDVLGNHEAAQVYYKQIIAKSPRNLNAKNNLGLSLMLQGQLTEAEATFKTLTERADSQPRFDMNLAFVYGISGNPTAAEAILTRYLPPDQVAATMQFYEDYALLDPKQRRRVVYGFPENQETVAPIPAPTTDPALPNADATGSDTETVTPAILEPKL